MRTYSVVLSKFCLTVILCVLAICGEQLYAQQRLVTGVVSDQDNFALPGAAVMVEGTSIGTMADENGAFTIKEDPGQVLIVSFIYFDDRQAGICWVPEKEYQPGSWGYVGGSCLYDNRTDTRYNVFTEVDVKGTEKDPIYQTQREGLDAFRADVPDGSYSVYLHFAELVSSEKKEKLLYALGRDAAQAEASEREFDVEINGVKVLDSFNIAKECLEETAVVKKFIVNVSEGKGLNISFIARKGQPVLNAVRIYRNSLVSR